MPGPPLRAGYAGPCQHRRGLQRAQCEVALLGRGGYALTQGVWVAQLDMDLAE